jgi:predicted nucleotidyltransferase
MTTYNLENKQTILNIIKEIASSENRDGFEIVGLFGSFAKGTATEFSDVDIAYKIDHKKFSKKYMDGFSKLLKLDEIKNVLQCKLCKKVDFISLNSTNTSLNQNILKDIIYV